MAASRGVPVDDPGVSRHRPDRGGIRRKADEVYDSFTPEQQELCRRIFLRLVQPGEGSEDTRRRASLREVVPSDPAQAAAVRAIIDRLADPESPLLTTERQETATGEGTLEVAHEALIRGWPQLRKWIETDRAGLLTHHRLTEAARDWADAAVEAKEGSLYTGARLAVATEWANHHREELGALEAAFLSASQENEQQRRADEAEKNRRLADAERQRAEEAEARTAAERRERELTEGRERDQAVAARRLRHRLWFMIGATAATIVAAGIAAYFGYRATEKAEVARTAEEKEKKERVIAEEETKKAQDQARIAESRRLAALSELERDNRLDRALLLAVEAHDLLACKDHDTANMREARNSLFGALVVRLDSLRSCIRTRAMFQMWPSAPTARPWPRGTAGRRRRGCDALGHDATRAAPRKAPRRDRGLC